MDLEQAKQLARRSMGDKRYQHTRNVEALAVQLAEQYGENPEKAALAALLHDCAKELPRQELLRIMRENVIIAENGEERPAPVWHGICASILARTQWGVTDEAVLSAIACHTTGKPGMSRLDKILFLADMTCAERDFPGVDALRALVRQDLDRAMIAALRQTIRFVEQSGKEVDPMSRMTLEDLLRGPATEGAAF